MNFNYVSLNPKILGYPAVTTEQKRALMEFSVNLEKSEALMLASLLPTNLGGIYSLTGILDS